MCRGGRRRLPYVIYSQVRRRRSHGHSSPRRTRPSRRVAPYRCPHQLRKRAMPEAMPFRGGSAP
jgi:hypothetical protein